MKGLRKVTDRQILLKINALSPARMSTLASELGVTRQAMSYRLQRLERLRKVSRTKGNKSIREPDLWRLCGDKELPKNGGPMGNR